MKNKTYAALLAGSTLWCLSIIAAPVFGLSWVYEFFSRICHQDPARSWAILGRSLPVCIRCASIYSAFTVSLWVGIKTNVRWLRASLVLMLAEFVMARVLGLLTVPVSLAWLGALAGTADRSHVVAFVQLLAGAAFMGAVMDGLPGAQETCQGEEPDAAG